jgi:ferredoxin-NADP reductase
MADKKGSVEILVKFYRPDGEFKGGKLTSFLDGLHVGDQMTIDGPVGKHTYLQDNNFIL